MNIINRVLSSSLCVFILSNDQLSFQKIKNRFITLRLCESKQTMFNSNHASMKTHTHKKKVWRCLGNSSILSYRSRPNGRIQVALTVSFIMEHTEHKVESWKYTNWTCTLFSVLRIYQSFCNRYVPETIWVYHN